MRAFAGRETAVLPYVAQSSGSGKDIGVSDAEPRHASLVSSWLGGRAAWMRRAWAEKQPSPRDKLRVAAAADRILETLLHRTFNHQSRGRVGRVTPQVRKLISDALSAGKPVPIFLLYNGGYRASPLPSGPRLIFRPDQTELMLLLQITRLHEKISAIYEPGVEFTIVLNNGVSRWVNDIPLPDTGSYAAAFRRLIWKVGAGARVDVLVQSELPGYEEHFLIKTEPAPSITPTEHRLVERFLGRACGEIEARHRFALYTAAEAAWGKTLAPLVQERNAIILRQVAHPASLSFRPFPGGAIRSQNGTLGFLLRGEEIVPTLLTTGNIDRYEVRRVPLSLPELAAAESAQKLAASDA